MPTGPWGPSRPGFPVKPCNTDRKYYWLVSVSPYSHPSILSSTQLVSHLLYPSCTPFVYPPFQPLHPSIHASIQWGSSCLRSPRHTLSPWDPGIPVGPRLPGGPFQMKQKLFSKLWRKWAKTLRAHKDIIKPVKTSHQWIFIMRDCLLTLINERA